MRLLAAVLVSVVASSVDLALPSPAIGAMQLVACGAGDAGGQNNVFVGYETWGIKTYGNCPAGQALGFLQDGVNTVAVGAASGWVASAPPGLEITHVNVPPNALLVGAGALGTGYLAQFYWNTGPPARVFPAAVVWSAFLPPGTTTFGWRLQCNPAGTTCPPIAFGNPHYPVSMYVSDVQLTVAEVGVPSLTALGSNNVYYQTSRWLRGSGWPISFAASDPSGIQTMAASVNGQAVSGAPAACTLIGPVMQNDTVWQQCPGGPTTPEVWSPTVTLTGDGPEQLVLSATSAAGATGPVSQTIYVDSVQPSVSFSGPTNVSSAAGTQYITATGIAGMSGIHGLSCSLDGAPSQWYPGAAAHVPVSGVGVHSLVCESENNSYDVNGQANWSSPATWALSIRQPSVSDASFGRIADKLKCTEVRERVRTASHWVTVHRRGKLVRVKRRGKLVVRRFERCHARVVVRRVCMARHCTKQRVLVLPHAVQRNAVRVRFGRGATVSGWLGTTTGVALGGQQVEIVTAVDNGHARWRQAAMVTTSSKGTWTARLPAGPSRLVEAVYGGAPTVEPAYSPPVHLIVPAKVTLRISPRLVPWRGTIQISGRVLGGYIPDGKLLRLRIGVGGVRGTVGIPNIGRHGRFHTTWTFAPGSGVVQYWFSVSTLNEADYPYAPGSSRRVYVTVGPG